MDIDGRRDGAVAVTLVLLPGLDGTGVFLRPLVRALPGWIRAVVVTLPSGSADNYTEMLASVRHAVRGLDEFVVLGHSFSGPLALMLANAEPVRTRGVILSATFVRAPRSVPTPVVQMLSGPLLWIYRLACRLPLWLLRPADDAWRRAKTETWRRVSARTIAARMRAALQVDARPALVACAAPIVYLAATDDRVVPERCVREVCDLRPSVQVVRIEGAHEAIHDNARAAAEAVAAFVAGVMTTPVRATCASGRKLLLDPPSAALP